jgi:hypothetical protein
MGEPDGYTVNSGPSAAATIEAIAADYETRWAEAVQDVAESILIVDQQAGRDAISMLGPRWKITIEPSSPDDPDLRRVEAARLGRSRPS